jgi:hypothetical protein
VASDSLAADSLNAEGSYGAGNPHTGISKQPGEGSTANVTDTSAAEQIDPARDASSRESYGDSKQTFEKGRIDPYTHKPLQAGTVDENAQESSGDNQQNYDSKSAPEKTSDNNVSSSDDIGGSDESAKNTSAVKDGNALDEPPKNTNFNDSSAPDESAKNNSSNNNIEGSSKSAKNTNFSDGSAPDESAENASFNQNIGGPNDPGRLGEEKFIARNSNNAADAGRPGPRDKEIDDDGQYAVLKDEGDNTTSTSGGEQHNVDDTVGSNTDSSADKKQSKVEEDVSETAGGPIKGQQDAGDKPSGSGSAQRNLDETVSSNTEDTADREQNKIKGEVSEAAGGPVEGQHDDKGTAGDSTDIHTKKHAPPPGTDTGEEIVDTGDSKLPMVEEPPKASDWQSMDARNVNV